MTCLCLPYRPSTVLQRLGGQHVIENKLESKVPSSAVFRSCLCGQLCKASVPAVVPHVRRDVSGLFKALVCPSGSLMNCGSMSVQDSGPDRHKVILDADNRGTRQITYRQLGTNISCAGRRTAGSSGCRSMCLLETNIHIEIMVEYNMEERDPFEGISTHERSSCAALLPPF